VTPAASHPEVLRVTNLRVYFPLRRSLVEFIKRAPPRYIRAVDGISFAIREAEFFCIVGESGCGKSTTGKAILRLVPVTSGEILFRPRESTLDAMRAVLGNSLRKYMKDGFVDVTRLPAKAMRVMRRDMQYVHQDPYGSLNPRYRIRQIVEEPLIIHGVRDPSERLRRVKEALERAALRPPEEFLNRYPHQLSGGQRQRVAIARAIVLNPKFIVADEPVSMLDVSVRAEVLEVMKNLQKDMGIAFMFITHDLATARYVCDRIAVLYLGKLVELGPAEEILHNPLHPYTKALIAAVPEPDPENRLKERRVPIKGEVPSPINVPRGCRFRPRCVVYDALDDDVRRRCESEEPRLVEVRSGHSVACWAVAGGASGAG